VICTGANPARGGPSTGRRSHGEEDRTRDAAATQRGTPDHGSVRRHSGMKSTRAATKAAPGGSSSGTRVWRSNASAAATASGAEMR
jgi:hypothetical protein